MTLSPTLRNRFAALIAAALAVWMGSAVAQGEFGWPILLLAALVGTALMWLQPLPLTALLLGAGVFGYVVGNRGFAQLSPTSRLPLLPAELILALAGTILVVHLASRRELPWRKDLLNYILILWIAVGLGRLVPDLRAYGFAAVRDFALVYYALFFFIAQDAARDPRVTRFLHHGFALSCATLLITQPLFNRFPELFLDTLTVRGIPVIFYKGDLSATFMAAGAVLFFLGFERTRRWPLLFLSLGLTAGCLATNNRASMLGLAVASAALLIAGRWRFVAVQATAGAIAALVLVGAAYVRNKPWEQTPVYSVYERVLSIADPLGSRTYSGETTAYKGDNNLFRSVWWRAVWDETIETNPWFGVGFGHDLAARFVREYYPEAMDEFSARSPHNVVLTTFARMGILGLLPFVLVAGTLFQRTVHAARRGPDYPTALWATGIVIFTSACFGVVLEGPMGAVVFWTLLGLANGTKTPADSTDSPDLADTADDLVLPQPAAALPPAALPSARLQPPTP